MAEQLKGDPLRLSQTEPVMIQMAAAGTKLRLANGATVEIVDNPRDGLWVMVRYLDSPEDPTLVGSEDMIFANDIVGQLKDQ